MGSMLDVCHLSWETAYAASAPIHEQRLSLSHFKALLSPRRHNENSGFLANGHLLDVPSGKGQTLYQLQQLC